MTALPREVSQDKHYPWYRAYRDGMDEVMALGEVAPKAMRLMRVLLKTIENGNAVVASHRTLAQAMGVASVNTVKAAVKVLEDHNLIETHEQDGRGAPLVYVVNQRVAWVGKPGERRAVIPAQVILSEHDGIDRKIDTERPPLLRFGSREDAGE